MAPRFLQLDRCIADESDWWRASPRAFGGQIAAHLLLAAADAAPSGWVAHSLHVHFLRPGRMRRTRYAVEPLREGRSFALYSVIAVEQPLDPDDGDPATAPIACGLVSFHAAYAERDSAHGGPSRALHSARMPEVAPPQSKAIGRRAHAEPSLHTDWSARHAKDSVREAWQVLPADAGGLRWWMRWQSPHAGGGDPLPPITEATASPTASGSPHDEQQSSNHLSLEGTRIAPKASAMVHAAAMAFLSDLQFLMSAGVHSCRPGADDCGGESGEATSPPLLEPIMVTSLDHVLYLHEWPIDASSWLLFEYDSPHAAFGRATVRARIWAHDGRLVASAVQEGVFRVATLTKSRL